MIRLAIPIAVLALAAVPGSAAARVRLAGPDRADLDQTPATAVRDTVIRGAAPRAAIIPPGAYGGAVATPAGEHVRLFESAGFVPDARVLQNWAAFFGSLVHGHELSRLTVYLTPVAEMESICSSDADGCYIPGRDEMVLPGLPTSDGVAPAEIAAHQ